MSAHRPVSTDWHARRTATPMTQIDPGTAQGTPGQCAGVTPN